MAQRVKKRQRRRWISADGVWPGVPNSRVDPSGQTIRKCPWDMGWKSEVTKF